MLISTVDQQQKIPSFRNVAQWKGFPGGTTGKESACQSGDTRDSGSITESGRSPGGGHGNPLHCSCLESAMDRGVSQRLDTTEMT